MRLSLAVLLLATALRGAAGFGVAPSVFRPSCTDCCRAAPVVAAARGKGSTGKSPGKSPGGSNPFASFSVRRAA